MTNGVGLVEIDFKGLLRVLAGGEWNEASGPETHSGLDYWYRSGRQLAYLNVDQTNVTVNIGPKLRFEAEIGAGTLLDRFVRTS